MSSLVEIVFAGTVYTASLLGCYDGDTCTVRLHDVPRFVAVQRIRFAGFDAPEIEGQCAQERKLARKARALTLAYMKTVPRLRTSGERDKYDRLLVKSRELGSQLVEQKLAYRYRGGWRKSWCKRN